MPEELVSNFLSCFLRGWFLHFCVFIGSSSLSWLSWLPQDITHAVSQQQESGGAPEGPEGEGGGGGGGGGPEGGPPASHLTESQNFNFCLFLHFSISPFLHFFISLFLFSFCCFFKKYFPPYFISLFFFCWLNSALPFCFCYFPSRSVFFPFYETKQKTTTTQQQQQQHQQHQRGKKW